MTYALCQGHSTSGHTLQCVARICPASAYILAGVIAPFRVRIATGVCAAGARNSSLSGPILCFAHQAHPRFSRFHHASTRNSVEPDPATSRAMNIPPKRRRVIQNFPNRTVPKPGVMWPVQGSHVVNSLRCIKRTCSITAPFPSPAHGAVLAPAAERMPPKIARGRGFYHRWAA